MIFFVIIFKHSLKKSATAAARKKNIGLDENSQHASNIQSGRRTTKYATFFFLKMQLTSQKIGTF